MRNCFRDRNFEVGRKLVYSLLKAPGWVQLQPQSGLSSSLAHWLSSLGQLPAQIICPSQVSVPAQRYVTYFQQQMEPLQGHFSPLVILKACFTSHFKIMVLLSAVESFIIFCDKKSVCISFQPFVLEAGIATLHVSEMNVLFIAICFQYLNFFLS